MWLWLPKRKCKSIASGHRTPQKRLKSPPAENATALRAPQGKRRGNDSRRCHLEQIIWCQSAAPHRGLGQGAKPQLRAKTDYHAECSPGSTPAVRDRKVVALREKVEAADGKRASAVKRSPGDGGRG